MSPYFGWDRAIRRFDINLHYNRSDLFLRAGGHLYDHQDR